MSVGEESHLTVLVAEDNAEWRSIITRVLTPDFEVIGYVERGDELVTHATRLHPDIVTLDVAMPGQSGLNALPALRVALPNAIVVVISTIPTAIYKEEAFRRGANAYVAKARVLSDLLPAIANNRSKTHGV
jgi:DNA-binding NarL/FixJ family response regulator